MPLCLSCFHRTEPEVLRNHAHYARLHGYGHAVVESDGIFHAHLRDAWRYSQILRHLRSLPAEDWLLVLDESTVVFCPVPVDTLLAPGRELLAADGPSVSGFPSRVMTGMLVLRNTPAMRTMLHELVTDASHVIALEADALDPCARLREAGALPCNAVVDDTYVHIHWRTAGWPDARIFALNLAPLPVKGRHGVEAVDILHDLGLQRLLARQVNRALVHGERALQAPAYPPLADTPQSSYNPAGRIAFVTLYTEHIARYARVAEHNIKRYCDRHGHAFHVYRAVPAALGEVKGNWAKPWVLQQHFAQHEWVVWIDADMLFVNPAQPFEPLLAGRDLLFAKDIGAWRVNSGLMGFRRTPANEELLDTLCRRIAAVADKSTVYASMGDQYYVNELLRERGLDGEAQVLDFVSVNTPHYLRTPQTFLMHFLGLGEPYRSIYMAEEDQASLRA